MKTDHHGGGCCGVTHLHNFGDYTTPRVVAELDRILQLAKDFRERKNDGTFYETGFSHLYEVVLTDYQMREWAPILKERGFKLGPRWYNSNSGNYCTMLFFNAHGPRGRNRTKTPYVW